MDYDVVVVGTGMGGGTLAWSLARSGKKVLMVERGNSSIDPAYGQNEKKMMVEMLGYESREIVINGVRRRPYLGGAVGGSSALYGAALLRPARADFTPGFSYGERLPRHLWDWPVGYDELEPWYDAAEELYRVSGDVDQQKPHIEQRRSAYPGKVPGYEPISEKLADGIRRQGFAPFHIPLAVDFERCLRCPTCPGYACPNHARSSSWSRCVSDAVNQHGAELWTNTEAVRVISQGNRAVSLELNRSGRVVEVKAERFVLSGGALGSPSLLIKSGLEGASGQVGRNYMYHAGAVAVGLFARPTGASIRFAKQVAFSDLYFGAPDFPHKLGYAQTIPVPGPKTIAKELGVPLPGALFRGVYDHAITLTGIVEDLPQPENRVFPTRFGFELNHRFHPYDLRRSMYYMTRLKRVMRSAGAALVIGATADKDKTHLAHQVGTCRFGNDPQTSVLDRSCRLHDKANVYVVDGSFFPTSLGVGPALTIAANALRVADLIERNAA